MSDVGETHDRESSDEDDAWHVDYLDDIGIVETTYGSAVNGEIALASSAARIKLGKDKACNRFLINGGGIVTADGSTEAIFERMTKTYHVEYTDPDSRFAVVNPRTEEGRWFAGFFEDLGLSRGWNVRRFESREEAISWLTACSGAILQNL